MNYTNPLIADQKNRIFIVTGAPGTGKTTWVKERRKQGDVVVDLDYILAALRLDDDIHHEDSRDVLSAGLAVKEFLINGIATGNITYSRAFIVTTRGADRIKDMTGGTVIQLDADPLEITRRIMNDNNLSDADKEKRIKIVEKFFEREQNRRKKCY